jgi:hypothetical protein
MRTEAFIPETFRSVTEIFERFCERHALTILAEAVEKHGSWEWSASGPMTKDLNRFLTLALTEESEVMAAPKMYLMELWAEVDNKQHFVRRLSSTLRVSEKIFTEKTFEQRLTTKLDRAWKQAQALREQDLTESYISPR